MAPGGAGTKRAGGKKKNARKQTPQQQDGAAKKRLRKEYKESAAKSAVDAGPPPPKVAELERFLFGSSDIPTATAATTQEDEEQPLSLIWEDRSGAAAAALQLPDSSDSEQEQETSSEDAAAGRPAARQAAASADSGSDNDDSDSEELNPSRLQTLLHSYGLGGVVPSSSSGESDSEASGDEAGEDAGHRQQSGSQAGPRGGPAWEDPEDAAVRVNLTSQNRLRKLRTKESQQLVDGVTYEAALRRQHQALNPRTSWADVGPKAGQPARRRRPGFGSDSEDDEGADEEELLQSAGGLLAAGGGGLLPPSVVEVSRMKDGNLQEPCEGVVQAVRFHPGGQLLLTASLDKRLRLFQVDGVRNPKVQSVFLPDLPIRSAAFVGDGGSHIVAAGRRAHFYLYDVAAGAVNRVSAPAGRREERSLETFAVTPPGVSEPLVAFNCDQGYVPLVSLRTRQWVANLKMNGTARCCAFSPDGQELVTLGGDGMLYTWDMRTRRCLSRQADEGCLGPAALAVAPSGHQLATGSSMGAVNLYRHPSSGQGGVGAGGRLEMVKTLLNLTTVVDSLAFSPDSQMLAMASRMKRDALRLVHLPSATVFANWPTQRTPLHYVHSLDFSPRGGFLAIGNAKGRALLYRLHHYAQA